MKITIDVNGEPTEIALTPDHITQVLAHVKATPFNIIDHLKTWEDACQLKGIDPIDSLPFEEPKNDLEEAVNGNFKMYIIAELLCGDWVPNWSDTNEYKYYPYFKWSGSGFGFSYSSADYWGTGTHVGSRLVFPTEELAEYAGTQFINIYNKFLTKPINEKAAN